MTSESNLVVDEATYFRRTFSEQVRCHACDLEIPAATPRLFSHHHADGACPHCEGTGHEPKHREHRCEVCRGQRLRPEALAYQIAGRNIADFFAMTCEDASAYLIACDELANGFPLNQQIAREPIEQLRNRIDMLMRLGLGYLTLQRSLATLSTGERQRVTMTSVLCGTLVNMLYVLDEPTAGLHADDRRPICDAIIQLRDRGNTVVVIEHHVDLIRVADHVLEFGPAAGPDGGQLTFSGTPQTLMETAGNLTGNYVFGRIGSNAARRKRTATGWLKLRGVSGRNLRDLDVDFPLGVLCVITGRSGSGKSTLIHDTLRGAVANELARRRGEKPPVKPSDVLPFRSISGVHAIQDVLSVDGHRISRNAKSCPLTYAKAFDEIRGVFAETVDAKIRNYASGHFSFNNAAGRCGTCEGSGQLSVDMQFLADVTMTCPACRGTRYRDEILKVRYRDRSIADVLGMTVSEGFEFFRGLEKTQSKLKPLIDVGLGYLTLGQPATTLSSGEAQRLKLAAFLGASTRRGTLFLMDEPATGLHFADVERLLRCFDALVEEGHSVIVIEHHPMVIAAAEHEYRMLSA